MSDMHVMLDLETMGISHDAAIVAIGAVLFNETGIKDSFYQTIDLRSSADFGEIDASTVLWWMSQSDAAKKDIIEAECDIFVALERFSIWIPDYVNVWGNGADFDNVILANAYKTLNMTVPWSYHGNKCFRTVKSMNPKPNIERLGIHHNALDDATYQANYLIDLEVL